MYRRVARSLSAVVLTVGMVSALLPVGAAQAVYGAQSQATRRGKNGTPAKKTDSQPATPATGNDDRGGAQPANALADTDEPSAAPTQGQQEAARQDNPPRRRKDPPPFDRPPLAGNSPSPSGTGNAEARPPATPPRGTTDRNGGSRPADSADQDANRSDRQAPILRRPPESDSRYPGGAEDGGNRQKPVLRRPSDPDAESDREPSRRTDDANPQPAGDDDEVLKLDATLVNIPVLVSDRSGRYVPQLNEKDFIVYEDGVLQEVAFFGNEKVPFNVVLLLDVSPSVQGSLQEIQAAALEFVRQMRAHDRIMVASFDRRIHYHTDFTSDRRELEWAIRQVDTGSGTSVYDAVYETIAQRLRRVEGRKALILLSDGEDTTSGRASYDDAVDLVRESDVLVYGLRYPGTGITVQTGPQVNIPNFPFPFPWPGQRNPWPWPRRRRGGNFTGTTNVVPNSAAQWPRRGARDFMRDVTEAGGGPVYDAERISDLSRLAARIAEELRNTYVLSYYPTNSLKNGGHRQIRIRVRGRDDIAVRHRRGYNAREVNYRPGT